MILTSARLQNFRSYSDSSFEFEPGVNIIVGPNASGKTNLLDALYLTATGVTIRPNKDFLIQTNKPWSRLDVLTSQNQIRITRIRQDNKPEFEFDDKKFRRFTLDKLIPVVLFEPNHLYQITTAPEQRRQFMDDILTKIDPSFSSLKNNYIRTLRQRNSLLKLPLGEVKKQIFAWDVRLCELAGSYVQKRKQLLEQINQNSSGVYSKIANQKHQLLLVYESKIQAENYSSTLLKTLQLKLELDHMRGFTGYGPHRDDMSIIIDNNDMRNVASRGETRSILLTLKVIEARILEGIYNQKPLLLLDDVFGELDGARRKSLIDFMSGCQTFITTTDADIIAHNFMVGTKPIYITKE